MSEENITKLVDALVALLPYLTGAVIGAVGGVLGTRYAKSLDRQAEATRILREKLEELVTEAKSMTIWLQDYANWKFEPDHSQPGQYPVKRIHTLVALYFPDMMARRDGQADAAQAVRRCIDKMTVAKNRVGERRDNEEIAKAKEELGLARDEYFEAIKPFVDECTDKMSSLLR